MTMPLGSTGDSVRTIKYHINDFFRPTKYYKASSQDVRSNYALIILNSEIEYDISTRGLWDNCVVKICADGGANRLFDFCKNNNDGTYLEKYIPDVIIGDLDSLRDEVRDFYLSKGSSIIKEEEQETNDLEKSLRHLEESYSNNIANLSTIILGGMGGRYDQEIATLHILYKWTRRFERMVIFNQFSSAFLLLPCYLHEIVPVDGIEGPVCGLLPLGAAVNSISTEGLQWNLENDSLEMGKFVSSSNRLAEGAQVVRVVTSEPLLFTWAFSECE